MGVTTTFSSINFLDKFTCSPRMRASSGSLAQLVEQRTLNPFVAGSIPARPTRPKDLAEMRGLLHFYLESFISSLFFVVLIPV